MSLPRRIVAGTTYLISRRCLDRRFYLRPSAEVNAIVAYALVAAALKHGVLVHMIGVQSNHLHIVVTDVRGLPPDFMRDYHREVAMALKELFGIPETVWSDAPASPVELVGEAAQIEAVLYTLLNPVTASLVFRAEEWPGLVTLPGCRMLEAKRPPQWFGEQRSPDLRLAITPPPCWIRSDDEWHARLAELLREREDELAKERRREGRAVMGRARVLHQDPFDRPKTKDRLEPKRNPAISTGRDGLAMKIAIAGLRAWRAAYRAAWELWRTGADAVFPLGTWWVVQRAGATAAA